MEVTGKQRNNDIELEFSASYTFYYKKPLKIQRLNSTYRTNKRQRIKVISGCVNNVSFGI